MSTTVLLGNGTLVSSASPLGSAPPRIEPAGAVAWQGERITAVGPTAALREQFPRAEFHDACGGLILPGLINLHHHFYSALARGLDPGGPMRTFSEILDRLWWRLDRALDLDAVRVSAELSAIACVRGGCTTVFDHHASPAVVTSSLDTIAGVLDAAGLSGVLCYEITDRNGHDQALAGLEENLRFLEEHRDHPRLRGMVGLHASFTLRDETLSEVAQRRPAHGGCHVHLAEDPVDCTASRAAFGATPLERFERYGLLDDRCLLAHGIHLEEREYRTIGESGAVIIHNPESNANNGVGCLDVAAAMAEGCHVGLGTDGMSSSMLPALRSALLTQRDARRDPSVGFAFLPQLLSTNVQVARHFFAEPLLGELVPGAPADVIVIDAPPPTPLDGATLFGHLAYGAATAPVRHTIARGRVLMRDFRHTTMDLERVAARASGLAPGVWQRFAALPVGTTFLGD